MKRQGLNPEERARALNDECVRMVQRHEKPVVIHAVRDAYRQALAQAERYKGIIRVPVPQAAIPAAHDVCGRRNLQMARKADEISRKEEN